MTDQSIEMQINSSRSDDIINSPTVEKKSWNILDEHCGVKIDENFVLRLKNRSIIVGKELKESCKILQLSSEWNFEHVLSFLEELNPKYYPNLFIFVIKGFEVGKFVEDSSKYAKIMKSLNKFSATRPLILQIRLDDNTEPKLFYKHEDSTRFVEIDQQEDHQENFDNFSFFLKSFLNHKFEDFENTYIDTVENVLNLPDAVLILKFLNALKLSESFFRSMILKASECATKANFIWMLDTSFESDGRILSQKAMLYLSNFFKYIDEEHGDEEHGDEEDDDEEDNNEEETSLLLTIIMHKNNEVFDYLITYWTHLIQQLPVNHQVKISTAAYQTNQFNVLCDLLEIADFPFPRDFELGDDHGHERLRKIILERVDLKNFVKRELFEKIDKFVDSNPNLKYVYNVDNDTLLTQAIKLKKYGVFYYLKSIGFQGEDSRDIFYSLDEKDRKQAIKQASNQRRININLALANVHKSILLISTRSFIHNRKISKELESKYREKIVKWLEDIRKVAPLLIDVAATCEKLKIVFDFESESTENVSLSHSNELGSIYPIRKWIFVGSKLSDNKREQEIKGVLAHELCHYVMRLVYENNENPYYENRVDMKEMFEGIARNIDKWATEDAERPDDECNGIISSVFTSYEIKDFIPELIVRVVQILTEFDDDDAKSRYLEDKYQILFSFWYDHVNVDLQNYLQKYNEVYKLNKKVGLLSSIQNQQIELSVSKKGIQNLIANKIAIVLTNFPMFFYIDILEYLKYKYEDSYEIQNLFLHQDALSNVQYCDDFREIRMEKQNLNVFIDCTKSLPESIEKYIDSNYNLTFVVSNKDQCNELAKKCTKSFNQLEINYDWNDLNKNTQKRLLDSKIKLQNNILPLCQLVSENEELSEILSVNFLKCLLEEKSISINTDINLTNDDKKFNVLFRDRNLKKYTKAIADEDEDEDEVESNKGTKLTQEQMIQDVANNHYVLVSDKAGTGKSWLLKNMARKYQNIYIHKWTSFIDLKQFKDAFSRQSSQPNFVNFMIEKILKLKDEIEIIIFKELYKNGKIVMFFDGFDEISQYYAEIVKQIIKAFNYNGGNQMWISTRKQFEVDLQKELKLNSTFGFDNFTIVDGRNLMAYSWIIWESGIDIDEHTDLESIVKNSPNLQTYMNQAKKLIADSRDNLRKSSVVGTPAIYEKMAMFFNDKKVLPDGKMMSDYYDEFESLLIKRSKTIKNHKA